ncbi:DUF2290 domain-containing protein [Sphingobacterium sp.]|uniref:DUF2290 domain-containing protein n=1 Tax=Sphingobacterium sp. TaxID=341027 RepID=UPI00289FDBD2|nr:DUF2290 domain-containing protein [Sphingobacterium sp.]
MTVEECISDINKITRLLIEFGLSDDQNFPSYNKQTGKLGINTGEEVTTNIALKNIDYNTIYKVLLEERNFNLRLADGALIQLYYDYDTTSKMLLKHKLAYFPSPTFTAYQNDEELYIDDCIYADILKRNILPVIVRFDYDPLEFKEILHPKCHLTLGQYDNCRLGVYNFLTPISFIEFVLKCFYGKFYESFFHEKDFLKNRAIECTLTQKEVKSLHLSILN